MKFRPFSGRQRKGQHMSAPAPAMSSSTDTRIVIAGAGPAAQALVSQLVLARFAGSVTVLSNRDDVSAELMELAILPRVSLRCGQPASHIEAGTRTVTTADGMEFGYDHLVIATGSAPERAPVEGSDHSLSYSTVDDAARIASAVKDLGTQLGRRPLGILVGTGAAAGQAEAVLRSCGVRPVRTTMRPVGARDLGNRGCRHVRRRPAGTAGRCGFCSRCLRRAPDVSGGRDARRHWPSGGMSSEKVR
jgi:3-phenylpropionate/trans-cinnamate dioxygenase ferredoxin reductase component